MTLSWAAYILTGIFEAIMIFMLLNGYLEKRTAYPTWIYGLGIAALSLLIILCNHVFHFGMLNLVGMVISIFIISFLFSGRIKTHFFLSVVGMLIFILCELIVMFIIASLEHIPTSEAVNNPQLKLWGIIVSKLLTFAIIKMLVFKQINTKSYLPPSYWLFFFMILATSMLAVYLLFKLQYDSGLTSMNILSVICSFGLLYSTFFALYLYENLGKQAHIIHQQRIYEQQIKDQTKHLAEIMLTQKQLRSFRHDLANHLISLRYYFKNKDCEQGLAYLENIAGTMTTEHALLKTGNLALDAIINAKKAFAESKSIAFETNIQIPADLPIEATDTCIIWGNALDNAIEACDKIPLENKKITLAIFCENSAIICKIVNPDPNPNVLCLQTTKKDKINHGLGLENIKMTLAKYNSTLQIRQEKDNFILSFVIFINQ